jgi:hypothetical protein
MKARVIDIKQTLTSRKKDYFGNLIFRFVNRDKQGKTIRTACVASKMFQGYGGNIDVCIYTRSNLKEYELVELVLENAMTAVETLGYTGFGIQNVNVSYDETGYPRLVKIIYTGILGDYARDTYAHQSASENDTISEVIEDEKKQQA